jgi:hypothetical protein
MNGSESWILKKRNLSHIPASEVTFLRNVKDAEKLIILKKKTYKII